MTLKGNSSPEGQSIGLQMCNAASTFCPYFPIINLFFSNAMDETGKSTSTMSSMKKGRN